MKNLDLIWNVSLVCPWDCTFCCTDAAHAKVKNGVISLRENSLSQEVTVSSSVKLDWSQELLNYGLKPNYLDYALFNRQCRGKELRLQEKMQVLTNITQHCASLDFAGGDPIACAENILVIAAAADKFGKDKISITSTGYSAARYPIELISSLIGTFEFTFDESPSTKSNCRPDGYNSRNILVAKKLSKAGVRTKCQIPLHAGNSSNESISNIVETLVKSEISEVLLMRLFPVGRGGKFINDSGNLSREKMIRVIEKFRTESARHSGPKIRLQCALKHLFPSSTSEANPCDMMQSSFGISYQGILLTSAWATNQNGQPLSDDFVLGSLLENTFENISNSEKFRRLSHRLDENWGHCKIFAYVDSTNQHSDAMFLKRDPLYRDAVRN